MLKTRDEYSCVVVTSGGAQDGAFEAPPVVYAHLEDARDQAVRMVANGYRLEQLVIVRRTVTYTDWEVVAETLVP